MNYLAHLRLAGRSPDIQLGNLLGDFVKGSLSAHATHYSPAIVQGLQMHREIDVFTDQHPIWRRSRHRISPTYQRFGGIFVDIFYDHFLAHHWSAFSTGSLDDFIADAYRLLQANHFLLPAHLQPVLPRLIAEDWLGTNQTIAGVGLTLGRVGRRLKRHCDLAVGQTELAQHYAELEADFLEFFPLLLSYAESRLLAPALGARAMSDSSGNRQPL